MSISHINAAIESSGLTPTEKLILILLANDANSDTGQCWRSQHRLAEIAGVTRQCVNKTVKALERKGMLSIENQFDEDGRQRNNKVRLHIVHPKVLQSDRGGVILDDRGGVILDDTNTNDPLVEDPKVMRPAPLSAKAKLSKIPLETEFSLSDERKAYLRKKAPSADPVTTWDHFRNHHEAHGSQMANWDAAWRTWCCNVRKFAPIASIDRKAAEEEARRKDWFDGCVNATR